MSLEFHGSSQHEQSKLYSLRLSTILGFAEKTDNQALLEKLLNIVAERALGAEFDIEADNAAIYIYKKLESLREKDITSVANAEAEMKRLADMDYSEARKFFEVFPYYYQDTDPEIAELEQKHEALFKQQ